MLQATSKMGPQVQSATDSTKAQNSLTNSAANTDGSDPSIPPGITRDMLPTPLRWQVDEKDENDVPAHTSPVKTQPLLNSITAPEVDGGDWVMYMDDEGDKYYHNEET